MTKEKNEEKKEEMNVGKKCTLCGIAEEEAKRLGITIEETSTIKTENGPVNVFIGGLDRVFMCTNCKKMLESKVEGSPQNGFIPVHDFKNSPLASAFYSYVSAAAVLFDLRGEDVVRACIDIYVSALMQLSRIRPDSALNIVDKTLEMLLKLKDELEGYKSQQDLYLEKNKELKKN